jgi:hypothetical protein
MPFFLLLFSKGKTSCSSITDTVSLGIPTRSIRDYSTFTVNRNFKAGLSARRDSAANAACRNTDIFNKACTLLSGFIHLF